MLWFHGVSVGESLANLTLVKALRQHYPTLPFLLTSTTDSSKALIEKQLDANMVYEKFPLDFPWAVKAFLDRHQPSYAIFAESELWPFMLSGLRKRNIPASLINARLSERSFKRWQKLPFLIKPMLSSFNRVFAQSEAEMQRFQSLVGKKIAPDIVNAGNIKFAAKPLDFDIKALEQLKKQIGERPCVLFASTHPTEEVLAVQNHKRLQSQIPDLLTIIVPRHPERGDKISADIALPFSRRSEDEPITDETQIYLADTLGELGLFFRLCDMVVMGNSFTTQPGGGHNPIEPAHLDCAILYGPEMFNFAEISRDMLASNAAMQVINSDLLAEGILKVMNDRSLQNHLQSSAKAYAQSKQDVLPNILEKLIPLIDTALSNNQ